MLQNQKERDADEERTVREFCAFCKRCLLNARADVYRERARRAKRERLFSDMRDAELARLAADEAPPFPEEVFYAAGEGIGVSDPDLSDALRALRATDREIVLLHYLAEWPDGRIGEALGIPRSTVQWRRAAALSALRGLLEEGGARRD